MRVIQYPHPLLRKKIYYNPSIDDDEVIKQLFETVDEDIAFHELELIGLAANQIGIETRICLYMDDNGKLQPLINPEIVEYIHDPYLEPWREMEACGSLPNYEAEIARARMIKVSLGKYPFRYEYFSGWEARIIQHEVDHLNGVLLIDYED